VFIHIDRDEYSQLKKELPEAEKFIEYIQWKIRELNLSIISERKEVLTESVVAEHYAEHRNSPDKFNGLLKSMTSGSSYLMLIEWENAQKLIRALIMDIREEFLATPKVARRNMTHASWNIEEAKMEAQLHFG
jgi:nucleoside diphosphate kinase